MPEQKGASTKNVPSVENPCRKSCVDRRRPLLEASLPRRSIPRNIRTAAIQPPAARRWTRPAASRNAPATPSPAAAWPFHTREASAPPASVRSEEHPPELQTLMRISYASLCLTNKNQPQHQLTA